MGNCEMCGKKLGDYFEVVVEGTMLDVCEHCSQFGNIVNEKKEVEEKHVVKEKPESVVEESVESMIENYNKVVKEARENKGLKQEDLAKHIGEKESVIQNIESKKLEPNMDVARKLEKFFNINLVEKLESKRLTKSLDFKDSEITIGDLIKVNKR
ncbi:TIGR00270 family protein [archaeon]|nr:TIGR00270 family protein [archaeon]|tara:strand:+ start:18287 stop:18751 length:465 start_codon:yes stop_codon:yes gene_type:complete